VYKRQILSFGFAFSSWKSFWISAIISITIWLTQWFGQGYIYTLVDNWFGWEKGRIALRVFVHAALAGFWAAFGVSGVTFAYSRIFGFYDGYSFWDVFKDVALVATIISLGITALMAAIGFFKAMRQAITEREQIRSEMISYKYESLRNQVNPHFLFNSLNVLTSLVEDEPKLAVKFIGQLSEVYRYVLDSRNQELVLLKKELSFIESFIFLLKIRFEDALEVEIDIPIENHSKAIVPMTLQLLVENAVKHNELSQSKPLKISIRTEGDQLVVSNRISPKRIPAEGSKVGLQNIMQRYQHFSDRQVEVVSTDEFSVKVPLLSIDTESKISEL